MSKKHGPEYICVCGFRVLSDEKSCINCKRERPPEQLQENQFQPKVKNKSHWGGGMED